MHLGHYFSVIIPGQQDCNVLIANYHAVEEQNLDSSINLLRSFGVKNIILQKDVFNPELYFRLLSLSKISDLNKMTQYKVAESPTGHLMTYPVLMAHDVVNYSEVLVGEDQVQHLEYSKKLLRKYNAIYEPVRIPEPKIVVGRVKDLRHPSKKMSKSSPEGCLFLDDSADSVRSKLKKATADELGLENLHFLYREFVGERIPVSNLELKTHLAEAIIERFYEPVQNKKRLEALDELTRQAQEFGMGY